MNDDDQKQGANHEPIKVDLQIRKSVNNSSADVSLLYWKKYITLDQLAVYHEICLKH